MWVGLGLGALFSVGIIVMLVVVIKCFCSKNSSTKTTFLNERMADIDGKTPKRNCNRKTRVMRMDMLF
jgi:hypothetical protein